jgi:hypothetical protein
VFKQIFLDLAKRMRVQSYIDSSVYPAIMRVRYYASLSASVSIVRIDLH